MENSWSVTVFLSLIREKAKHLHDYLIKGIPGTNVEAEVLKTSSEGEV